jgi:hypothetical protein
VTDETYTALSERLDGIKDLVRLASEILDRIEAAQSVS